MTEPIEVEVTQPYDGLLRDLTYAMHDLTDVMAIRSMRTNLKKSDVEMYKLLVVEAKLVNRIRSRIKGVYQTVMEFQKILDVDVDAAQDAIMEGVSSDDVLEEGRKLFENYRPRGTIA